MYGQSPPTWLIFACIGALALPSSVVAGALGWLVYLRFTRKNGT